MAEEQTGFSVPKTEDGKIDIDKLPKEIADLINHNLSEKREANKEAQLAKAKIREIEAARESADKEALEQQAQFKTLYEKEKAAREKVENEAQARLLGLLREKVGIKAGLPEALITRLQGATEEELTADAELIKAALPQSTPPKPSGTQSNTTPLPRGTPSGKTDDDIRAWLRSGNENPTSEPRKEGNTLIFGG
jgi:hypothetical protein